VAENENNKPNFTNSAYKAMARGWGIMSDVLAGTLHLREGDSKSAYLPPEPAEKSAHYGYRRDRAIFFNATDRTLNGLVGMVFRNDPKLSETVPEAIRGRKAAGDQSAVEGHWENIDNAGAHGAVFCKEVFTSALRDGHAAILVDMPPPVQRVDGLKPTKTDEVEAGHRPYWVSYKADQIINWRTKVVNGQTKVDLIVFKECSQEPDGEYGEKEVVRYRVLRPGSWELYREIKGQNNEIEAVLDPDNPGGPTSLSEIPVAIVYGRKEGILKSRPPLLDLALINIAHYQKYSDFSIYLHVSSRPILWFRNRDTNKQIEVISAYSAVDVGENGQVDFAETTGAALAAASQDIKDIEERMSILGLSLLVRRTGAQTTATEERNDQIEESSDLETAARSMRDAVELALKFHAQYLDNGATTGGNVELGASLDELTLTPEELNAYSNMVAAHQLSLETLWSQMAKAGKLPSDFDPKKEREAVENSLDAMAERMLRDFERGGPPPKDDE
jgi:uncharacterized protein DUF4055